MGSRSIPALLSLVLSFLVLVGCHSDAVMDDIIAYGHFVFHPPNSDSADWDLVNQQLENNYDRIIGNHGLDRIGAVHVHVFTNTQQLRDAMKKNFPGIPIPDFARAVAPSPTDIYMVQPSAGVYTGYIHEFTHCVTQNLNPTIPNNPRWLWESVALFEAGEFTEPRTIAPIVSESILSLNELNDFNNQTIYQVGYLIGEFISKEFGKQKFIQLIVENGDVQNVLGLSREDFIKKWYQYVRHNYNF